MYVVLIDPSGFVVAEFRIYLQLDAQEADVRPGGRGAHRRAGRPPEPNPTAYDRVDDRFAADDSLPLREWLTWGPTWPKDADE